MTPETLLNLYAERAALCNLQDEDGNHFDDLDEIDRQILNAAPDIARGLIEARLTLAAEQGRVEGAPSEGWIPNYTSGQYPAYQWRKTLANGERVTVDYFPVERRWEWCFMDRPNRDNFPWVRERFEMTARAAMRRVDSSPPAKVRAAKTWNRHAR